MVKSSHGEMIIKIKFKIHTNTHKHSLFFETNRKKIIFFVLFLFFLLDSLVKCLYAQHLKQSSKKTIFLGSTVHHEGTTPDSQLGLFHEHSLFLSTLLVSKEKKYPRFKKLGILLPL